MKRALEQLPLSNSSIFTQLMLYGLTNSKKKHCKLYIFGISTSINNTRSNDRSGLKDSIILAAGSLALLSMNVIFNLTGLFSH